MEKEVSKAVRGMDEVEGEVARKKESSRKVKEMKHEIDSVESEALQLVATEQHLRRLQANLSDRLQRLESQVGTSCGTQILFYHYAPLCTKRRLVFCYLYQETRH